MARRNPLQSFETHDGTRLAVNRWHNFGGNVSYRAVRSGLGLRMEIRCDTTKKVVKPGGPAGHDAIAGALFNRRQAEGYAAYCFGPDYDNGAEATNG